MRNRLRAVLAAACLLVVTFPLAGKLGLQDASIYLSTTRAFSQHIKGLVYAKPLQNVLAVPYASSPTSEEHGFADQDGLLYYHPASTTRAILARSLGGSAAASHIQQKHPILYLIERGR